MVKRLDDGECGYGGWEIKAGYGTGRRVWETLVGMDMENEDDLYAAGDRHTGKADVARLASKRTVTATARRGGTWRERWR